MARVKAIFDADILIHLVKTKAINFATMTLGEICVSEFVYQQEIDKGTIEGKQIEKLKNSGKIKVLTYHGLTEVQKRIYNETYKRLRKEDVRINPEDNPINEGERVTASFVKACNIYYYMSDDNKAAPHIRSLTAVEIVNFCDILFITLFIFQKTYISELRNSYNNFIDLYDPDKIPRILKEKGNVRNFEDMMKVCYDKFHQNSNLKRLLNNANENAEKQHGVAAGKSQNSKI